jgi:hypothetical protein
VTPKWGKVSQQGSKNMASNSKYNVEFEPERIRITSWLGIIHVLVMGTTAIYACCMQVDQDLNGNIF